MLEALEVVADAGRAFVVEPLAYALLVALLFAPLEWLRPERREQRTLSLAGRRVDLLFASVGAVAVEVLLFVVLGAALGLVARAPSLELGAVLGPAASAVVGLLIFELVGYLYRLAHAVPALWRLHAVHHSAPTLDWLASFRQHPVEIAVMTLAQNLPLVLLGIPLSAHAAVVVLIAVNTAFVHANLDVGPRWLAHVIATPRFHHRHHDRDAAPRNFASMLPLLDHAFGTWSGERAERFGLPPGRAPSRFVARL